MFTLFNFHIYLSVGSNSPLANTHFGAVALTKTIRYAFAYAHLNLLRSSMYSQRHWMKIPIEEMLGIQKFINEKLRPLKSLIKKEIIYNREKRHL